MESLFVSIIYLFIIINIIYNYYYNILLNIEAKGYPPCNGNTLQKVALPIDIPHFYTPLIYPISIPH